MRIVHEIHSKCMPIVSYDGPYAKHIKNRGPASGFPVRIAICTSATRLREEEMIELEGDAAYIVDALELVCKMIRASGDDMVRDKQIRKDWKKPK